MNLEIYHIDLFNSSSRDVSTNSTRDWMIEMKELALAGENTMKDEIIGLAIILQKIWGHRIKINHNAIAVINEVEEYIKLTRKAQLEWSPVKPGNYVCFNIGLITHYIIFNISFYLSTKNI